MNDTARRRRTLRPVAAAAVGAALAVGGLVGTATPASADVRDLQAACAEVIDILDPVGFVDIDVLPASTQLAVDCLAHYGITYGTSREGEPLTYSPGQAVTRLQMAKFLSRVTDLMYAGATEVGYPDPVFETGFADVDGLLSDDDVYDISVIQALGVTQGKSPTRYAPREAVTREEMAIFINRMQDWLDDELPGNAGYYPADSRATFSDVPRSSPAAAAVYALEGVGIVQGTGAGRFSPKQAVTRAQMALFIMRHIDENVAAGRLLPAPDADGNTFFWVEPFNDVDVIDGGDDRIRVDVYGLGDEPVTAILVRADRVTVLGKYYKAFPGLTEVGPDPVRSRIVSANGSPVPGATSTTLRLDADGEGRVGVDLNGDEDVVVVAFEDFGEDGVLGVALDGSPEEPFGVSGVLSVSSP